MNDFLQLQPENMTYAWVSVVIAIIGLLVAIFFLFSSFQGTDEKNRVNDHSESLTEWNHLMIMTVITGVFFITVLTFRIGSVISTNNAYDRNIQMVQSAYNIQDVKQDDVESEQNVNNIDGMLAGMKGSAAVTATSDGSYNVRHFLFRVDDDHRLRVYQDTKSGHHLITPCQAGYDVERVD